MITVTFERVITREVEAETVADARRCIESPDSYRVVDVTDAADDEREFLNLCEACGEPVRHDDEVLFDKDVYAMHRTCAEGGA